MQLEDKARWLRRMPPEDRMDFLMCLEDDEIAELAWHWELWARPGQLPPPGDWRQWLVCAGRGFGKTRIGAEWVRQIGENEPKARIALVGASIHEVRAVMVEGESGILVNCHPDEPAVFEPSLRRVRWASGAQAFLYSAGEPESLRGPQHSHAWCDEVAKWDNAARRAENSWDNLQFGMRLGERPQLVATTTPRPVPLMRRLLAETGEDTVVTRGSTFDNAANLPPDFVGAMRRQFRGTTIGRQELDGEILEEVEGALWSRALIEACRDRSLGEAPVRVVVAVDPPASACGDACGIVVASLLPDGTARVLADCSIEKASPERWARAVARAARDHGADRVVAEANQGGAMVASVLRAADISLPLKLVHATRGKVARAEPVAALYEAGRVTHAGLFAKLEDQLCGLMAGGGYEGPGRSPDRADALVWALTELMLKGRGRPRVSGF